MTYYKVKQRRFQVGGGDIRYHLLQVDGGFTVTHVNGTPISFEPMYPPHLLVTDYNVIYDASHHVTSGQFG